MRYSKEALCDIGVNQAIAEVVEDSAHKKLEAIRRDPRVRAKCQRSKASIFRTIPLIPNRRRYGCFSEFAGKLRTGSLSPPSICWKPYQRESMEHVLRLETVQKNALRAGILCHFVGLVIVINAVPGMLDKSGQQTGVPPPSTIEATERLSFGSFRNSESRRDHPHPEWAETGFRRKCRGTHSLIIRRDAS